jgi:hypothetical protein
MICLNNMVWVKRMKRNKSNDAEMHDQELGVCTLLMRDTFTADQWGSHSMLCYINVLCGRNFSGCVTVTGRLSDYMYCTVPSVYNRAKK